MELLVWYEYVVIMIWTSFSFLIVSYVYFLNFLYRFIFRQLNKSPNRLSVIFLNVYFPNFRRWFNVSLAQRCSRSAPRQSDFWSMAPSRILIPEYQRRQNGHTVGITSDMRCWLRNLLRRKEEKTTQRRGSNRR